MSVPKTTTSNNDTSPSPAPLPQNSRDQLMHLLNRQISYRACIAIFLFLGSVAFITPFKEYYLGNYVTDPFDEIRDEVVARKLNQLGVVISGAHYYDSFDRKLIPLIDLSSKEELSHATAETLGLTEFLVRANVRRDDLLTGLPADTLSQPVNLMVDVLAPLCTDSPWETQAQLLFGNYFPAIRHEFCRDFRELFPRDRFFNHNTKSPVDKNLVDFGNASLGLIAVVNMSEVYLRHFNDAVVVRKIMKNVQEGYMELDLSGYWLKQLWIDIVKGLR
ncbi:hypothetical protein PI124_g18882 [Phytophthora idaei]|nr:hypothetical protein PI124_g18882 [Phytophthora idaei]